MMEKFKVNTGVLFKNDKKLNDNHPDYKGSITVGGVEYWISSWIKQGKNGKFMGLAVTPKESTAPTKSSNKTHSMDDVESSDIPF
jgi:hypothetical protein